MLTEAQEHCPYCHEQGADHHVKPIEDVPGNAMGLIKRKDGWHVWTNAWDSFESVYPINACPICRRDLRSDEK